MIVRLAGTRVKRALPVIPSLYVASGSWHVVMVPILSVAGCFMRANAGCQTPWCFYAYFCWPAFCMHFVGDTGRTYYEY